MHSKERMYIFFILEKQSIMKNKLYIINSRKTLQDKTHNEF